MPEISEVRIRLVDQKQSDESLQAFVNITIDRALVIKDLKIILKSGKQFVAMPSRKIMDKCDGCGTKNHVRAHFCNDCGVPLADNRARKDTSGRSFLFTDTVHPIHAECRENFTFIILSAYQAAIRHRMETSLVTFNGPTILNIQEIPFEKFEQWCDESIESSPSSPSITKSA